MKILKSSIANYCEYGTTASIETDIFGVIDVQTTDGLFRSDLGCLMSCDDYDEDIEIILYDYDEENGTDCFSDIILAAKKVIAENFEDKYISKDITIRVWNAQCEVLEVNHQFINSDSSSYQTEHRLVKRFDNYHDAKAFATKMTGN